MRSIQEEENIDLHMKETKDRQIYRSRARKWRSFLGKHQGNLGEYIDIVEKPSIGEGQLAVVAKQDLPKGLRLVDIQTVMSDDPELKNVEWIDWLLGRDTMDKVSLNRYDDQLGSISSLLNHSCDPNIIISSKQLENGRLGMQMKTMMNVKAGEELLSDYMWGDTGESRRRALSGWNSSCSNTCKKCFPTGDIITTTKIAVTLTSNSAGTSSANNVLIDDSCMQKTVV